MPLRRTSVVLAGLVVALSSFASEAGAVELGRPGEPLSLEAHGFVSQGYIVTSHNNYLARSTSGSFEFAEIGLNFTGHLTDKLRLGLQLFSHDLGPVGNYSIKADWFYLDYHWQDWLGLRAGRTKLPFGLYNDTSDIDAARVPVLLPQSVYPIQNRDFLLAQTGLELYGRGSLGSAGALDYRLYGGTIYLEVTPQPASPIDLLDLTIPYVVGGRLLWETPLEGLRVGGSVQALRLDTKLQQKSSGTVAEVKIPAVLAVGSLEYAFHDLLLATEYSRWFVKAESSNTMLFPESEVTSERAYGMASYRINDWLQPGVYYSVLYPHVDNRRNRDSWQHDWAATVRFDINANWLFKIEGHYMLGTAGLASALNDNVPLRRLERSWVAVLAKTTAYF
jgi:hypothetical protein